jgi:hypothetical protein
MRIAIEVCNYNLWNITFVKFSEAQTNNVNIWLPSSLHRQLDVNTNFGIIKKLSVDQINQSKRRFSKKKYV